MPRGNPTPVRSVRISDDLWQRIGQVAAAQGVSVTDWIVETLRRRAARAK